MYDLTPNQRAYLDRRRAGFDEFLEERLFVLVDFCNCLELPDPYRVLNEAEVFCSPIDEWVARQNLHNDADQDDRIWLAARLTYYLGELLVQRFHGCWFVEENPNGQYFGNYVVGRFSHFPSGRVDPALAIRQLINQPVGRSLAALVDEISSELVELAPK